MIRFQNPFRKGQIWFFLLLVFNTAWLAAVYFVLPDVLHVGFLPYVYLAVGGALTLWFVIYNKGFTHRRIKPENMPQGLTGEEQEAWNAEGERLFRNSRWALTLILPILLIFLADSVLLFLLPSFAGWFQ